MSCDSAPRIKSSKPTSIHIVELIPWIPPPWTKPPLLVQIWDNSIVPSINSDYTPDVYTRSPLSLTLLVKTVPLLWIDPDVERAWVQRSVFLLTYRIIFYNSLKIAVPIIFYLQYKYWKINKTLGKLCYERIFPRLRPDGIEKINNEEGSAEKPWPSAGPGSLSGTGQPDVAHLRSYRMSAQRSWLMKGEANIGN